MDFRPIREVLLGALLVLLLILFGHGFFTAMMVKGLIVILLFLLGMVWMQSGPKWAGWFFAILAILFFLWAFIPGKQIGLPFPDFPSEF